MRKLSPTVGERHGRRTITQINVPSHDIHQRVEVACDCGRVDVVPYHALRKGLINQCAPCGNRKWELYDVDQLVGSTFGVRTITRVFTREDGHVQVDAVCPNGHVVTMPPAMTRHRGGCGACKKDASEARRIAREANPPKPTLSRAEMEANKLKRRARVLDLIQYGIKQKDIAVAFGISEAMVTLIKKGKA